MTMEEEIYITDLIDAETLQKMQDAFCEMTNIAAGISDANGVAVTKDTISSDFCMNFNKKSPIGRSRCQHCDKHGGEIALERGRSVTYHCHTGLVDFASPIMVNGKMVGCFIGGQVRTEELDEDRLHEIALEIEVDPDEYVKAARKIRLVKEEELEHATKFIYKISNILSDMAYNRYLVLQANEEIEKAAQMKSDFLANMSHEIRTPMNAVIGMAEMALREELPPNAREYVSQIISSGKTLLTIINDILDFSKIESGKMDIEEVEYEPMSIINDVANIVMTRIGDKDLELILDVDPNLPRKLIGDSNRLKQIIINLANNAVKFTKKGQVVLSVGFEQIAENEIYLKCEVADTGIGIKKEDMKKLFQSFQQVDSKRNRNIEGTGLGLAISKKLVSMMGGKIMVESEYGKGSVFSFYVCQKIFEKKPSVEIKEKEKIVVASLVSNSFLQNHFLKDMKQLNINYMQLNSEKELEKVEEQGVTHLFIEGNMLSEQTEKFIREHPAVQGVLMIDFRASASYNIQNLMILKKPVYVLNIAAIFNHEDIHLGIQNTVYDNFEFVAPEAKILIVDDNAINLTVAEGLLKPLKMQIETASGGKEAVEKISSKMYDLIFMDHMMPELDGVETTHIIRRFHPEYDKVPIIALTANAISGTKEMFLREGMNDFVAKPIEMRTMISKLRHWLPKEKIKKVHSIDQTSREKEKKKIEIEGLDTESALKLLGNEELFWKVLKDYYHVIQKKADFIEELEQQEDWHRYTIEVHALKSASRQIGAAELSEKAANMEKAGHAENGDLIHQCTGEMLEQYRDYIRILSPFFKEEKKEIKEKKKADNETLMSLFADMRAAMDELDMDRVEEDLGKMDDYQFDPEKEELLGQLHSAVQEYDVDACEAIMQKWEMI